MIRMVAIKRRKNTRQRARTTHGYGSMKKNRGAGHRGGRGRAGSGKRGDVKKPSLLWEKGHKHKGRVGFKTYNKETITTINLALLESKMDSFVKKGFAQKKGDVFVIDLKDIKRVKILGSGKVTLKYEVTAKYASQRAIEKIANAGGKIILPSVQEETKAEKSDN